MTNSEIIDQCRTIMSKIMQVDKTLIDDETTPDDMEAWDSLSHQRMILDLEKEFAVQINPEEGIEIESFEMLCELITKKMKN